jgi:two-component system phosphate regulon sensor histidine kinase PhoR
MNLDNLQYEDVYPELFPLVDRLREQRETIDREAETRERMRREFSANVSHELKTPLTSISGFAELMRSGLCDEEKMIEFAGDIYRESQRMIALINDTIRISELDEGGVHDEAEEVDLLAAAESAVESLSHTAGQRGIKMRVKGPEEIGDIARNVKDPDSIRVSGSPHLIREIIYNLCDNAVKYNREGGKVIISVWNDGENACVSVEDTGIGIPASEQERVFERFYRVDKSHSRKIGGTGLGLSIVKHAAQFHDASIQLESEIGRGTRITLRFPRTVASLKEADSGQADP